MTLLDGQIGRTLVKNVLSVNGGGGTGGVGSVTESMSCLGECMHVDVCEGKAMEGSIRAVGQVQTYTLLQKTLQRIAGGDTLLVF